MLTDTHIIRYTQFACNYLICFSTRDRYWPLTADINWSTDWIEFEHIRRKCLAFDSLLPSVPQRISELLDQTCSVAAYKWRDRKKIMRVSYGHRQCHACTSTSTWHRCGVCGALMNDCIITLCAAMYLQSKSLITLHRESSERVREGERACVCVS